MGKVYFVSGIDTGVGKTVVTGLMARALAAGGRDVITVKFVQTGNVGGSEDIDVHRAICGGHRFPEDEAGLTAPPVFRFPSSPIDTVEEVTTSSRIQSIGGMVTCANNCLK